MAQHGDDAAVADHLRSLDEFPLADRQHRAAHHTHGDGHVGHAEGHDDAVAAGAEHRHEAEREQKAGKGEQRIVDHHQDAIRPATQEAGKHTEDRAEDDGEDDGG